MRASLEAAQRLARALDERLRGRSIERVWRPAETVLLLKLGSLAPARLLIDLDPAGVRVDLATAWPPPPARPDQTTLRFRAGLEGGRVREVRLVDDRALELRLSRGDGPRSLRIQLAGRYPNAAVVGAEQEGGVVGEELARMLMGRPGIDTESPPLRGGPLPFEALDDGAWLLAWSEAAAAEAETRVIVRRLADLRRAARSLDKKLSRRAASIGKDLERAGRADDHRRWGELLKGALHLVMPGAETAAVPDYSQAGTPSVEVPLSPALGAVENMQRHFRLHKRYRGAQQDIARRHAETLARLRQAQDLAKEIEALQGAPEAPEAMEGASALESRLRGLGWRPPRVRPRQSESSAPALPYHLFRAIDGTEIYVGRGARHNDTLTFRHARASDIWLHARDVPGSHVILRNARGHQPSSEALLDAATLAAWHSRARGETITEVTWTERKHIRKPPGAPSGRVTVAAGRTLAVRADPPRLNRLYEGRPIPE